MAVSPDGQKVYASIFESGETTIVSGPVGDPEMMPYANDVVGNINGPYEGANPPPFISHFNNPPLARHNDG
jgi:hypothetical protein